MADAIALTPNDSSVLSQIFDPESAPTAGVYVDPSLPSDPYIIDPDTLRFIKSKEAEVIRAIEVALRSPIDQSTRDHILSEAYTSLSALIDAYPKYASLRNNRAQLIRLQRGDSILISLGSSTGSSDDPDLASTALSDLDAAISLLTPTTPQSPVSPASCRVLAQAHTQRAALYHAASGSSTLQSRDQTQSMRTAATSLQGRGVHDLEEAASKDFFMGGRYGNEIGKALAVHTNPTAKLCGQMVQEAMRREYTPATTVPI
ncbi:hypothetical protein MMC24_001730 [Lignoscripta atroalba]|nr:hypothetical protein [Lignoscripta atroalba]